MHCKPFRRLTAMIHLPILGERNQMTLHDQDTATKFETKEECLQWINDRVVRFKLKIGLGKDKDGKTVPGQLRKADGKILNTKAEGFQPGGTDEPLDNYASPEKRDDVWMAIMKVR